MAITIERWNGNDLQTSVYQALSPNTSLYNRQGQQVQVQPPGAWPTHIRTEQRAKSLQFVVQIISGDVNTAQRELQDWFAIGTEGEFEITEDGVSKVLDAVAVSFQRYEPYSQMFSVTLIAADPRWRSLNPISAASLITSSGGSFTVNNPGNATIDDPVITLRPVANKAAASGYLYKLESIIAWRAARGASNYAVEITEGWDHATEVGASRSQSDADDVRVLVDGVEVPRWIGEHANNDANSAATKLWINMDFSPRRTAVLQTAMTVASPTEGEDLEVVKGGTLGWPRSGALLIDDEVILYSGRTENNANGRAAFTGITRGARNTTVATHSAATTMYWVEHRVQVVYGNTGASAPDSRADLKPMLDLTSSTVSNERFEWLNFADSTYPGRSMQWLTRSRTFDDQYDKILAPTASPLTALTWEYQSGGAVSGKLVGNTYYIDLPTGTGSSGGNVASLTRTLSDTMGMWLYGVDDAGQDVVLQKFAGALTSASANITAPTNPVYRLECWAFNQIIASSAPNPPTNPVATVTVNGGDDPYQQVRTGSEPVEAVAFAVYGGDTVGGEGMIADFYADNSNVPALQEQFSAEVFSVVGSGGSGVQWVVFPTNLSAGYKHLPPDMTIWVKPRYNSGGTTFAWYVNQNPYLGSYRYRASSANAVDRHFRFRLFGRPSPLAASFTRFDEDCFADDGDTVVVDGVTIHLSTTESPYVALKGRQSVYRFVNGTLYNETTGDSVKVNATCAMSNELRLSIGDGIAVNIDDENGTSFASGVEYANADSKFTLAPGNNALRFVETGLVGVNVELAGFARWE